ncbi:MAG: ROK family protein [Fusobacteriaceae bacterium]|nr:ROK family protein [Fusobacteriaceae bacterium]
MEKLKGNSIAIKEVNINIIREAIKNNPFATKPSLAKETGLTSATVGTILNELLAQNEILEINQGKSTGGRPAKEYSYNFDFFHCLMLFPFEKNNITYFSICVSNLGKTNLWKEERAVNKINLNNIKNIIKEMLGRFPKIKVVGFGNAGTNENDTITFSDYSCLEGLNLTKELEIPVVIENDVNSAAIGFNKRKGGNNNLGTVYIYFPESYPPGSALLLNNKLYKGQTNCAGEISNIKHVLWNKNIYNDFDNFCKNSAELIEIMSAVLNPTCFILSGNFLTEKHINQISSLCSNSLPNTLRPAIYLTTNYTDDLILGLKELCINRIFPEILLTRNKNY